MTQEIENKTIVKSKDVADVVNGFVNLMDEIEQGKEHLWVLGLDVRNTVLFADLVSIGTTSQTLAHPREIFRRAIANNSVYIILAHNHPSEDITPSTEDLEITAKLVKGGKLLDILLIDHVIVNGKEHTSLKALGLLG